MIREHITKEDDEWDPMKEAYYSEIFNTYKDGPGSYLDRSLQPFFRRSNTSQKPTYKLFVYGIPLDLTEVGLKNIFLKFGVPNQVYLCTKLQAKDKSWAFVEFSTLSECQEAIKELSGKPPLNLGVHFARSDEEKERRRKEHEEERTLGKVRSVYTNQYELPVMETPYPSVIGRGRGIPLLPKPTLKQIFSKSSNDSENHEDILNDHITEAEDEILCRRRIPRGVYSPYQGSVKDPFNFYLMMNVSSSYKGHYISMGRAIPLPIVETRPKYRKHIRNLQPAEMDINGFPIGTCALCGKISMYSCERCEIWYCSETCKDNDSSRHSTVCLSAYQTKVQGGQANVQTNNVGCVTNEINPNKFHARLQGGQFEDYIGPMKFEGILGKGDESSEILECGDSKTSSMERKEMQWPQSVVRHLNEGHTAACEVFSVDCDDGKEGSAFLSIVHEDLENEIMAVFSDFPDDCLLMPVDSEFRPSEGELIAGLDSDGCWRRCTVIREETDQWLVAFCDTGMVRTVSEIRKMPNYEKYKKAPGFAAKCYIVKPLVSKEELFSEDKMKVGSQLRLKIQRKYNDNADAEIETVSEEVLCKVKLESWIPEEFKPKCIVVNDGDKVKISSFFNLAAFYVQPSDKESKTKLQHLLQDVSGACIPIGGKKPMNKLPPKGTIVGCRYSGDGNFYRALITEVKSDEVISVSYIDFGNQECVSLDKILDIPDKLKKVPAFAVRIGLKISKKFQLNKEVITLINKLILENEELKFVCPDNDLRSCELYTNGGDNINEKINELFQPTWKKHVSQFNGSSCGKFWTMDSLVQEKLPKPSTDKEYIEIKFLILNCPGKCAVVGCLPENPLLRYIYEFFPAEISEYCEHSSDVCYVPRQSELCVAKFTDDCWYRVYAVESRNDECLVYFIDYGNWVKVNHKNIRKIIPEYLHVPVIAAICSYKGFTDESMTVEEERRLKVLLKPNTIVKARMWQSPCDDEYILDIPEVTEILTSENYLPSS